jgi:hypothetical protein
MADQQGLAAPAGVPAEPVTWRGQLGAAWLAARMALLALALPSRLRRVPAVRVAARLTPRRPGRKQRPRSLAAAAWLAGRLVNRLPWQYGGHCVRRSLLLYYAATRSGYPAEIVFGVRREGDALSGHAWLELDHEPFLEPIAEPHGAFVEMQRWPPTSHQHA